MPQPMEPVFIEGKSGPLFAVHHNATVETATQRGLIIVPPFAEEMNRSRRMAHLQAKALSAAGIGTLILDLFGTGDSAGGFQDSRWDGWLDDIEAGRTWLSGKGYTSISLLGLRLGALLATACAAACPGAYERLVLWQPISNGEVALTQFLRIRMAAGLTGAEDKETTKELKQRLEAGENLEIAGYDLHPDLARALAAQRLAPLGARCGCPIHWLEVAAERDQTLPPASRTVVQGWRELGLELTTGVACGEPFWTLQETTVASELIGATTALFAVS